MVESLSGPGSTMAQTENVIKIVSMVIQQYNLRKLLDIPCGDFNWMKHVDHQHLSYHGGDIVDELIENNRINYGGQNHIFQKMDLLKDRLPQVDLIICRDCLVHFSFRHCHLAIANIRRSRSTYLLTTTFPGSRNRDVTTGDWFMINLQASPFNFPEPVEIFSEGYNDDNASSRKSLALWRISDLPEN
jgi:hypothetical protein